jgi:hypothetical protein
MGQALIEMGTKRRCSGQVLERGVMSRDAVLWGSCQGLESDRVFARLRRESGEVVGRWTLVVAEEWWPEMELRSGENGEERLE